MRRFGSLLPSVRADLLIGLLLVVLTSHAIVAQPPGGVVLRQEDLNGDGKPDLAHLAVVLRGSGDIIRVYDRDGDMQMSTDWRQVADMDSDMWLFDVSNDGTAQLVIQFSHLGNVTKADLYADLNGDENVDLDMTGFLPRIVESGVARPVVSASVIGDWLLPDGQLNWNLRFTTDGGLIFDTEELPAGIETLAFIRNNWLAFLIFDGQPDMEFTFHDSDRNGVPEYLLWRLFSETPPDRSALRARVWSNVGQSVPIQPTSELYWPLLVSAGSETFGGSNYFDTPPFLGVNWSTMHLSPPQFHGYPIEEGFHVHNLAYFNLGVVNYANFEIAQAYYDLAEDRDTRPELHIRHRYFGPEDPMAWDVPTAISEVRYSWHQFDTPELAWDYALGLANRVPVDSQIDFPDFSYHAVPYRELPAWVLNSSWDISTLIAPEGINYLSTEGIYEWGPVETGAHLVGGTGDASTMSVNIQNSLMSRYLAGEEVQVDMPETFNEALRTGLRGEVRYTTSGSPFVYFSGVDHRLHLLHANHGVWNIDSTHRIDYLNSNGDAFIDQWSLVVDGVTTARLIQAGDYVILADEAGVTVRRSTEAEALFIMRPPADHADWLALGAQIEANRVESDPVDFQAMFAQIPGESWSYPAANLNHIRLTQEGVHFSMEARASNGDVPVSVYVILNGGTPIVAPRHTLGLSAVFDTGWLEEAQPVFRTPSRVGIQLSNDDTQDTNEVRVTLLATAPGKLPISVESTSVQLAAGEQKRLWFDWTPPEAGEWELSVTASPATPNDVAGTPEQRRTEPVVARQSVIVVSEAAPTVAELISLRDEQPYGGVLILALAAALVIGIFALAALALRSQSPDER